MSKTPLEWLRERRRLASTVAVAVLLSAPVALAIAHEGYPISDVDLSARNVWVTNSSVKMAGRLNVQIEELTGGVQTAAAAGLDVLQDGDDIFVVDDAASTVTRIESTVTEFGAGVSIPPASTVSFGGGILAVVSPAGGVYAVDARGDLEFDPASEPVVELAAGAKAVTSTAGVIFAAAPGDSTITRVDPFEGGPQARAEVSLRDFDITVIGDHGVVLDRDANAVIFDDGRVVLLGASQGLRLQQAGPEADSVVVATTTGLVEVGLDGSLNELGPRVDVAATAREYVAAPVVIGACVHGAWAQAGSYVGVCDGREAVAQQIPGMAPSAHPVFRVNRSSFALNDLVGGAAWLIDEEIIQVDNWDDVAPQDETETEGEDDSTTQQTFENQDPTLNAHNEPPVALDDSFGVRPGKVTILDVLGNDSDSDGDVLVITKTSDVPESRGVLDVVDDGRALQFHPAEGSTAGTFNFRYTVSDGRGGTSEARVEVAFHANDENAPPAAHRVSGVAVEQGQSITYNVLNDWRDPDGDDLTLIGASVDTGDLVRFTSDGFVTFTSLSAERTVKTVSFTVSDGREQSDGVLSVQVVPSGSLAPVAIPDFVSTFVGRSAELEPLGNGLSPAGSRLSLVTVDVIDAELVAEVDPDRGVVVFSAGQAGSYYASYVVSGGSSQASTGLIRVDVADDPSADLPPIAVKDTAYVRPKEPTLVPVLANDASPSGRVIGIQSVEPVDPASGITVEVLASTRLRVTAPSALSEPVEIGYTISDGVATSTSSVTVIPVPELTKHQAPIANDDAVKVRVGDIVSVPVLANDLHPDGVAVALDTALVQANIGVDGLAFVTEDSLRLQAPTEPGTYSVTYRIFDKYEESAVADVTVTVIGADAQNNKPPLPSTLVSRVFQGSTVTVEVPLDGIDPDGDSVVLTSASGPNKGTIISSDSHSFVYRAGAASTGTDTFSYELRDTFGAVATGEVRIGILERPETLLPPTAVPDAIVLKPGRLAEFSPSANDSDPNGLPISFGGIVESPESTLTPEVTDDLVTVTAPATPGTYTFRYLIENSEGASSEGLVTVEVDEDASVLPPVAVDHVIETADIIGLESIDVSVLDGATNPGGRLSELEIEFDGPNVANATVIDGDTVRVVLTSESQAIAYRLVNARDGVSGMAFIVVPRFTDAAPPALKPEFSEPVELALNETRQWSVSDLVDVPSGRDVRIIYPDKANAGGSVEGEIVVDESTLQFDPIEGFRGDTSLTFTVTDGASADDPIGNIATLTLPIFVGDPEYRDVAPETTVGRLDVEAGGDAAVLDLRSLLVHPNPDVIADTGFGSLTGLGGELSGGLSGSELRVSAPSDAEGVVARVSYTASVNGFDVVGEVEVRVVASKRALAQAVDDVEPEGRPSSVYTIRALDNDVNPFAADGEPLRITEVAFDGDRLGSTVQTNGTTVTVTTGTAKSGTINLFYTVRDATGSASREVTGRITVVVASAPEPVTTITLSNPDSEQVAVVFDPPSSSNGAEITGYTVRISGTGGTVERTDCLPGATCLFTGRTNGAVQTVVVAATNKVGTTWSSERTITPYGTPTAPVNPALNTNSSTATATITPTWSSPSNAGGGSLTYEWEYTSGTTGSGTTSSTSAPGKSVGAGTYRFHVRACNPAGCGPWSAEASRTISDPPPRVTIAKGSSATSASCGSAECARILVDGFNFTPNSEVTIQFFVTDCGSHTAAAGCDVGGGYPGDPYDDVQVTANASGRIDYDNALFGFPGAEIVVRIVGSPANATSNYLTW